MDIATCESTGPTTGTLNIPVSHHNRPGGVQTYRQPPTDAPARSSKLSAVEIRILGCLVEKEQTTPDVYPLTLNGLITACNQTTKTETAETKTAAAITAQRKYRAATGNPIKAGKPKRRCIELHSVADAKKLECCLTPKAGIHIGGHSAAIDA